MKIPELKSVARAARKQPFRSRDTIYRHVVTIFVDTAEVNEDRVKDAVQAAVDEVSGTIQRDEDVTFDAATVVAGVRCERNKPALKGSATKGTNE